MSHWEVCHHPDRVETLHLRFRYDKSPRNFSVRRFGRSGHKWLCPVLAAISIIRRALRLEVDPNHPVGVFRKDSSGEYTFLQSSGDIIPLLHQAIRDSFPEDHYYVQNIHWFTAHSFRVTAALALYNVGWTREEIAFRLCWVPQSVEHYIHECASRIDHLTIQALKGALQI